jgi:hypothetical protein
MYKIFTETYKVKKDCSKKRKDQTVAMNEWYANFHMVISKHAKFYRISFQNVGVTLFYEKGKNSFKNGPIKLP